MGRFVGYRLGEFGHGHFLGKDLVHPTDLEVLHFDPPIPIATKFATITVLVLLLLDYNPSPYNYFYYPWNSYHLDRSPHSQRAKYGPA